MCENETKGWHGSYSLTGRTSAEKYHVILHKDSILTGKIKTKKIRGIFAEESDEAISIDDSEKDDNHLDIFTLPPQNDLFTLAKQKKYDKKNVCKTNIKKAPVNEKYKYHLHHHVGKSIEKKKAKTSNDQSNVQCPPTCTKYNPKMECVWNRTIIGPKWEKTSKRISPFSRNKGSVDFNVKPMNETTEAFSTWGFNYNSKHAFLDMDKQTKRGEIATWHDVRIRSDKPFTKKDAKSSAEGTENSANKKNNNNINNLNTSWNESTSNSKITFLQNQMQTIPMLSKFKNGVAWPNIKHSVDNDATNNNPNQIPPRISGPYIPDFSKTISREYINHVNRDRSPIRSFNTPNYACTEPNPHVMISYSKGNKIKKRPKYEPMYTTILYDPDKNYMKANFKKSLNFERMTPRPLDASPWPAFMKGIIDRRSMYWITEKTLEWNNYSNGKLPESRNSFNTKKSFNKVVNMNQWANDKGVNRTITGLWSHVGRVNKVMEFYSKNLDESEFESNIKFDGVTYKSVPTFTKLDQKEKDRFNIDFRDDI